MCQRQAVAPRVYPGAAVRALEQVPAGRGRSLRPAHQQVRADQWRHCGFDCKFH